LCDDTQITVEGNTIRRRKISEQNKAINRRIMEEVIGEGNIDLVDELVAEDVIDHNPMPGQAPGTEGLKQMTTMMHSAFPDLKITVEDQIAEGDLAVDRFVMTGTHRGEFMGIPASGNKIRVTGILIHRIQNGKVVEHWEEFDAMTLMQQLGAIPSQ